MIKIFGFCKQYLMRHLGKLIAYVVIGIIMSATSLISPYIMGSFIDKLVSSTTIDFIYGYFVVFVSINLTALLLGYFSNIIYINLQTRAGFNLNSDIICRLQRAPLSFIQGKDTTYLNQRINNDSNALIIFCINIIQNIITNVVMVVAPAYLMFMFNKKLSAFLAIIIVMYFTSYILFRKKLYNASFNYKEAQANFFAKLNEQLSNVKFIKLHGLYTRFFTRLNKGFDLLMLNAVKYQKTNYIFSGLDRIIMIIAQMAMLFLGGIEVIAGRLSIGEYTIISSYFTMILSAIRYFFTLGQSIQDNKVSYNRLVEIQEVPEEGNGYIIIDHIQNIQINNISFSYGDKEIMHNFSANFLKGKTYAILGPNGSGKSTLIDILLGLYTGEFHGEILYNGIPITEINMNLLRGKNIGISEQEPTLIADTLIYNLTFGNDALMESNIENKLAEMLGLNTYFSNLTNGYNTVVNENSNNLSGGEKQKISILRTLLKDNDVIIFDEPTSALDKESSSKLKQYLKLISNEKIIIIITHDNEFASECDEIIKFTIRQVA